MSMDTMGTISSEIPSSYADSQSRTEALERLRYLGRNGGKGILTGTNGTGKTWLLQQLVKQLRRDGVAVAYLNLNGVGGPELAHQFAARLGLGVSFQAAEFEVWARLQDYTEAARHIRRPIAFVIDHLDRAKESVFGPLSRLMDMFGERCSWLMSSREITGDRLTTFVSDRSWLRVELLPLLPMESARVLNKVSSQQPSAAMYTTDGVVAAHEFSAGRLRQLRQLAELASMAAEVEDVDAITGELVYSVTSEIIR